MHVAFCFYSPSTQLKYDIVASKFMTGIENHNKRNAPLGLSNDLGLIGTVLQIIVSFLVIVGTVLHWIWKRYYIGYGNGYKSKRMNIAVHPFSLII